MTNPLLHNHNVNMSNVNDNDPSLTTPPTTSSSFSATTSMIISRSTTIHQDPISSDGKIRTNHRRTQHVKVSKYNNRNGVGVCNRQNSSRRKCLKCKESSNNVEMLKSRVFEIEKLVNSLAQKTQMLANSSQRSQQLKPRFRGIDLTNASLEELQKLVKITTDIILSSPSNGNVSGIDNRKTSISIGDFQSLSIGPSSSSSPPQLLEKPLHSEPLQETLGGARREGEGVIIPHSLPQNIINNNPSHQQPYNIHPYLSSIVNDDGKQVLRQDSGFSESNQRVHNQHHNKFMDTP